MPGATPAKRKDRNGPADGDLAHDSARAGDRAEALAVIGGRVRLLSQRLLNPET
jgi:hypothetical protein